MSHKITLFVAFALMLAGISAWLGLQLAQARQEAGAQRREAEDQRQAAEQARARAEQAEARSRAEADQARRLAATPPAPGAIRLVVFYLKPTAPAPTADQLAADCQSMLAAIPGVKSVWAGRPPDKATPKPDYHAVLSVQFATADEAAKLLDHAQFQALMGKYADHLDKMQFFDFQPRPPQ